VLVPPRKETAVVTNDSSRRAAMREAIDEIVAALDGSRRPVVYAGVEIERFGLMDKLRRFVERVGLPVATSLMGKAVLPERHANFIGNYFGRLGPEPVRRYVESSDCILALGMLMTSFAKDYDFFTYYFTLFLEPMFLFSGTFFPLSSLPDPVQKVAWLLPLYHPVALARRFFYGYGEVSILLSLAWLLILTLLISWWALRKMTKRLTV